MKIFKFFIFSTLSIVLLIFLAVLYDLSYYDPSYVNRSAITFNKNNLNSKKIKKFYTHIEKIPYFLGYQFLDSHKEFWKIEDENTRDELPEFQIIPAKTKNFVDGSKKDEIERNYENWTRSHGGYSNLRFSNLDLINKSNVKNLEVAWVYKSNDVKKSIQANPIIKDGLIYFPTPGNSIVCLDAATGKEIWKYKVQRGFHAAKRGLLLWQDKKNNILRLIFTNDDQLISLNAQTGVPIENFGKNGIVKIGSSPTTPVIVDEQIIIGSVIPAVEVYDVYNGKLQWKYYLRKLNKKLTNYRDFKGGSPWGGIASDNKNGILYLTTGNAAPYLVGIQRPGKNLYADSVIAFDIRKKNIKWYFQETCHDLWNNDIAGPPILTTINKHGKRIDVVVAVSKTGNTLILDKNTGEPIFDFVKRKAPVSKLPGQRTCEYQPDLKLPEPFSRNEFKLEHITNKSPEDRNYVLNQVKESNYGFYPTYETNKFTISYNLWGGSQWPGASIDPDENVLYVTSHNLPTKFKVFKSFDINKNLEFSTNFLSIGKNNKLDDIEGYPGVKPPWGSLTAINLNSGKILWQVPLGYFDKLKEKGFPDTGTANFGGATASSGDLIFASGTLDKLIRAFDAKTGAVLWSHKLPYIGSAPPSIYKVKNEQYVVVPATGGWSLSKIYPDLVEQGDAFVAFKLKKN